MLLGLTALTALFILVAPWVIGVFGNPGHDTALAVGLSRVLFPIVDAARRLRDHRRDPQQLRPLHRAGDLAGLLEHRDHRRARDRRPAGGDDEHEALRVRLLDPDRDGDPGAPADAVAARARRQAAPRPRLARPGREARLRADGPGHARARPDQRERRDRHLLRVAADRSATSRRPRSRRRSSSTCSRRGCSRSRSRRCSSRRCRASPRAATWTGSGEP